MNNKILLIQSPPWGIYTPPLGIAYLATFLKNSGYAVDVLDLNIEIYNDAAKELKEVWENQDFDFWASGEAVKSLNNKLDWIIDKIVLFNADVIGFSVTRASAPILNCLLSIIRERAKNQVMIIVGGAGASFKDVRSLFRKDLIDYFIIGDGEYSLRFLIKDKDLGNPIQTNQNYITWKDELGDNAVCLRTPSDAGININDIPSPTFEEFNLSFYVNNNSLSLISSRGCIRACVFCCDAQMKKPYRFRDPVHVISEIRHHVEKYNTKNFEFSDLLINGSLDSLDRFCNLLLDSDLRIGWGGQATIRPDMGSILFKKMRKAGCGGITFGCESFSDNVLKMMHKGVTSLNAHEAFIKAKEADMHVEINLIVGFPGESEEDIDKTIDFIRKNADGIDKVNSLNICTIDLGMYLYEHLDEYNIDRAMINDWYAWFNRDMSNTLQIRLDRHKRVSAVCKELNLGPSWQNIKR